MKYFNGITNLEQAKQHYRTLAKNLHPDKGGTAMEFQKMQGEYKNLVVRLQTKSKVDTNREQSTSPENDLMNELGKIAKMLIKQQVPQNYLRQKIQTTESLLKKGLFGNIMDLLDNFK